MERLVVKEIENLEVDVNKITFKNGKSIIEIPMSLAGNLLMTKEELDLIELKLKKN